MAHLTRHVYLGMLVVFMMQRMSIHKGNIKGTNVVMHIIQSPFH